MSSYLTLDWRQKQLKDFKVSHIPPGPVIIKLSYDVYSYLYEDSLYLYEELLNAFIKALKSTGRKVYYNRGRLYPKLLIDVPGYF